MKRTLSALAISSLLITAVGCSPPAGNNAVEKRQSVMEMQKYTLDALYKRYPYAKEEIAKSYGYAVMSRDDIMIYFGGFGGGYGVATESASGKQLFIKDAHAALCLAIGMRDSRGVLIFSSKVAYEGFIHESWDLGIQAEVAAASRDRGFEQSAEDTFLHGVKYYQFTDSGDILAGVMLPLYHVTPYTDLNAMEGSTAPK